MLPLTGMHGRSLADVAAFPAIPSGYELLPRWCSPATSLPASSRGSPIRWWRVNDQGSRCSGGQNTQIAASLPLPILAVSKARSGKKGSNREELRQGGATKARREKKEPYFGSERIWSGAVQPPEPARGRSWGQGRRHPPPTSSHVAARRSSLLPQCWTPAWHCLGPLRRFPATSMPSVRSAQGRAASGFMARCPPYGRLGKGASRGCGLLDATRRLEKGAARAGALSPAGDRWTRCTAWGRSSPRWAPALLQLLVRVGQGGDRWRSRGDRREESGGSTWLGNTRRGFVRWRRTSPLWPTEANNSIHCSSTDSPPPPAPSPWFRRGSKSSLAAARQHGTTSFPSNDSPPLTDSRSKP